MLLLGLVVTVNSWAGRTDVLPEGVFGINLQLGHMDRLSYRYSESGLYEHLDRKNSFVVDAQMLSLLDDDAKRLITALDALSPHRLGSQLSLGLLSIRARPEVSYWAPALAYGLNKNWTLGIGLPILKYVNHIQVTRSENNIAQVQQQVGGLSAEIDAGLQQLAAVDLRDELKVALSEKGYEPLDGKNDQFLGDIRLMSLWQFSQSARSQWQLRSTLELPTGPDPNPDDLTDLGAFGNLAFEQKIIRDDNLGTRDFSLSTEVAAKVFAPKAMIKRVPKDESDVLPAAHSKEEVVRDVAINMSLGTWMASRLSHWLSGYVGVEYDWKGADKYTGSKDSL